MSALLEEVGQQCRQCRQYDADAKISKSPAMCENEVETSKVV